MVLCTMASLFIMHSVSPLTGMLPLLLVAFTIPLLLSLAVLHWAARLNAFMVLTVFSMTGLPFSILMHNFLEGLAKQVADPVLLHNLLDFFYGAFFIGAMFACPAGLAIGVIGAIIGLMHSTDGPENDFR